MDPSYSLVVVPSLLYYPLAVIAFVRLSGRSTNRSERVRTFLDEFTVLTSVGVLLSHFVAMPRVRAGVADFSTLLHPVGDVAALLGVATLLLRRATCVPRGVAVAFAVATVLSLARSCLRPYLDGLGADGSKLLTDALWLASNVAYVAAAERQVAALGSYAQRLPAKANP